MAVDAPNQVSNPLCVLSPSMIPDQACVLSHYVENESALLAAFSYYRVNATAGWTDSHTQTLKLRRMLWEMPPGLIPITSYISSVNSCIKFWH